MSRWSPFSRDDHKLSLFPILNISRTTSSSICPSSTKVSRLIIPHILPKFSFYNSASNKFLASFSRPAFAETLRMRSSSLAKVACVKQKNNSKKATFLKIFLKVLFLFAQRTSVYPFVRLSNCLFVRLFVVQLMWRYLHRPSRFIPVC